jgi:hypothetical protein
VTFFASWMPSLAIIKSRWCNNPNFWKIEINKIYSNTKFWIQQKTFIVNSKFISCLSKIGNLSLFAPMLEIRIIGERF